MLSWIALQMVKVSVCVYYFDWLIHELDCLFSRCSGWGIAASLPHPRSKSVKLGERRETNSRQHKAEHVLLSCEHRVILGFLD